MIRNYYLMRKSWRKFYRAHREAVDLVGDFLGALSIFAFLYFMYIFLWLLEIGC